MPKYQTNSPLKVLVESAIDSIPSGRKFTSIEISRGFTMRNAPTSSLIGQVLKARDDIISHGKNGGTTTWEKM